MVDSLFRQLDATATFHPAYYNIEIFKALPEAGISPAIGG